MKTNGKKNTDWLTCFVLADYISWWGFFLYMAIICLLITFVFNTIFIIWHWLYDIASRGNEFLLFSIATRILQLLITLEPLVSIQVGCSSTCTSPNEHFKCKCHMFDFRLISLLFNQKNFGNVEHRSWLLGHRVLPNTREIHRRTHAWRMRIYNTSVRPVTSTCVSQCRSSSGWIIDCIT